MVSKKYTYGIINRISRSLLLLYSVLFVVVGLIFLFGFILALFDIGGMKSSFASTLFWYFVGFGIWSPFVFIFWALIIVDIEVEDDGLRTKFILNSLFISWDDIEDFKPGKTLGLLNLKRLRILVTKNALTPFHRLCGLFYGGADKPCLIIGTNIGNHEELFKIIGNNIKKKAFKE